MTHTPTHITEATGQIVPANQAIRTEAELDAQKIQNCEARGGKWDPVNRVCVLAEPKATDVPFSKEFGQTPSTQPAPEQFRLIDEPEGLITPEQRTKLQAESEQAEVARKKARTLKEGDFVTGEDGKITGVVKDGKVFFLPEREIANILRGQAGILGGVGGGAGGVGGLGGGGPQSLSQRFQGEALAQEGQQLAGQVGQLGQQGILQTNVDFGQAITAGARGAVPGALGGLATGVAAGIIGAKIGGTAGAIAGPGGALVLGAIGFAVGVATGIFSDMKSQRTDNTNAQQRVLDEGKQILNDWITFAEQNPTLRAEALRGFNLQLQQIQTAYRQMKLDTSQDVLKFESAVPNLAEFSSFYSPAGERDVLFREMQIALGGPTSSGVKYLEMVNRRFPAQ